MAIQRRLEDQNIGTIDNKQNKRKPIHRNERKPRKSKVKTQVANY